MVLRLLLAILVVCAYVLGTEVDFETRFNLPDILPVAPEDLQYAFIIFRHGIRSPIYRPFQTEKQFKKMWPEGMGALTDEGKRLMIHVGESLRTRYQSIVPDFDEKIVQFTSTHSGRATMSAYCVAAGMFPLADPIFGEIATWQPIPVWQNTTYDKHKLFSQDKAKSNCPRYTEMREVVKANEKKRTPPLRKKYYTMLNSKIFSSYRKTRYVDSLPDNSKIYDIFKAQLLNGKELPVWAVQYMPVMEKMKQLRMWNFIHGRTTMIQYYTGPIFNQILSEMTGQAAHCLLKDLEETDHHRIKMHLHGSHDITVCPVVWSLSRSETYLALPGDTVIIEMTSRSFVKAYLYVPLEEDENKRFQEISLKPLCGKEPCRLTDFTENLKDIAFDEAEWKRRCYRESPEDNDYRDLPQDVTEDDIKYLKNLKLV